ncbi:MAG: hypothetical protein QOF64_203, partial [Candidatus Binatota bacterium]|nr:hypothetical protein [Candidatus Binatota bacterium]
MEKWSVGKRSGNLRTQHSITPV